MNQTRWSKMQSYDFGLILILAIAAGLRFWDLGTKPPHFDEGINGHFVAKMWKDGFYRYDPTNFHGPLYFYLLQFAEGLLGRSIETFRFMNGLIGLGVVWMLATYQRFFGRAAIWAALFVALSPAFVFYTRYAIHEMLFVLLQLVFVYGFFEWKEDRSSGRALAMMSAGFFGTLATKETFFIFFGTWLIALAVVKLHRMILDRFMKSTDDLREKANRKLSDEKEAAKRARSMRDGHSFKSGGVSESATESQTKTDRGDLISIFGIGALIAAALFSGFFLYPQGLIDMFRAFAFWTKTGTGSSGHEKPFIYWIELLAKYEWPFLVALVLSPLIYFVVPRREKIVVLVGFGTWLAYSIIPYKTPWLILNMLWALGLSAGFLIRRLPEDLAKYAPRFGFAAGWTSVVFAIMIFWNARQTVRLSFFDYAKAGEPYVYVQTTKQFKTILELIQSQLKRRPEDLNMKLAVLNRDTWPMPWIFGFYPNLKWGKPDSEEIHGASVILIDHDGKEMVESRLKNRYWKLPFQIRDAYDMGYAYLEFEKFKGLVQPNVEVVGPIAQHKSSAASAKSPAAPAKLKKNPAVQRKKSRGAK